MQTNNRVFNFIAVETACAIMDALVDALATAGGEHADDPDLRDALAFEHAVSDWYADNGRAALRHFAIEEAAYLDLMWDALTDGERDLLTWDFEFVPAMLELYGWREAVETGDWPARPDLMTAVLTAQALARAPSTSGGGRELLDDTPAPDGPGGRGGRAAPCRGW